MKLRIVTDSTADIPKQLVQELDIHIVPLKVNIEDRTYLDGVTLTTDEFYEKLQRVEKLPTTSQPSPMDFTDTYEKIAGEGDDIEIISIHLSGSLSGTYQTATIARDMVADKVKVHVVNSRTASYALGSVVVAVARAIKEGKSLQQCLDLAQRISAARKEYFVMDTLMYLQKGGRIGKASAVLGSLLNVKPILTIDETGEVASVDKVRGKKKAVSRIVELCKEFAGSDPVMAAVIHTTTEDEALALKEQVEKEFVLAQDVLVTQLGPVIGTYGGPGLLAVTMYKV